MISKIPHLKTSLLLTLVITQTVYCKQEKDENIHVIACIKDNPTSGQDLPMTCYSNYAFTSNDNPPLRCYGLIKRVSYVPFNSNCDLCIPSTVSMLNKKIAAPKKRLVRGQPQMIIAPYLSLEQIDLLQKAYKNPNTKSAQEVANALDAKLYKAKNMPELKSKLENICELK